MYLPHVLKDVLNLYLSSVFIKSCNKWLNGTKNYRFYTGTMSAKKTPLYDAHVECGGRMVEFAGYELPVQYSSVVAESKTVREVAGMFDVSHMARLHISGEESLEFLEKVTTHDVAPLDFGQGQYSLFPNEQGGVVDDLILYRLGESEFKLVVNAANHTKDVAHLKNYCPNSVEMVDETEETGMVAVQGPKATEILTSLCPDGEKLGDLPLFGVIETSFGGVSCFAARSGYTGEDGFELICKASETTKLWNALKDAGVLPCGLGSRDVLRVEAGLPLYGHELTDDLSPITAGLGWVISKEKEFLGSEKINFDRENKTDQMVKGIQLDSKRIPQPGLEVVVDGKSVGHVTSGVYSPLLECGIGFALIDRGVKFETPCSLDIRGRIEPGKVVNKRFFVRKND